jgi:hypothetical protein
VKDFLAKEVDFLSFVLLFSVVHDKNQFLETYLRLVENQWL